MTEQLASTRDILSEDYVIGKHVYGNLYGLGKEVAGDQEFLEKVMTEAARISNARIIDVRSWRIPGKKGGVSILILVDESHLALHTWTEYNYASLDIYTCGEHTQPLEGFKYVIKRLRPKKYTIHYVVRDSRKEEIEITTPEKSI